MVNGMKPCWPSQVRRKRGGTSIFLRTVSLLLLAALVATAQFKSAGPPAVDTQKPVQAEVPTFSAKVNLVRVLVTVKDNAGAVITNLSKSDFTAIDSEVPQQIAVFDRNTSLALSVAILLDTSGSTRGSLPYETQSIRRFLDTLIGSGNSDDAFEIFSFNWRTNLELDFTRNVKRAHSLLKTLHGDGGTSLYDSMFLASDTLGSREGRHVMVIVTDGGDTTSYKKYNDALRAAQEVDAVVYPIVVVPVNADPGRNLGGEHALETLAESTGGKAFSPQGVGALDNAFSDIIRELRTQYLLGFYPQNVPQQPRLFHPLKVGTINPNLHVTARSGYYEP